jgi:diguanylate cyclase (GGDEF)-like protein/PAS domain S-box-containing protein
MSNEIADILRAQPLEEEGNWSRQIIESVVSGITISDARLPDLPLIYVNPAFERLSGYDREEILGKNCRFLQGPDTNQPNLVQVRKALKEGTSVTAVLSNYRKGGALFWNELYMSPIHDLGGRLTHFVGIQNDVTARVKAEARLAHIAQHDALTGLANRSLLMDRIGQAILRARRNGKLVAILFLDIDNFKFVNDMFGHDAGDALLVTVADRLMKATRENETAGRLAGDEFIVVLEDIEDELDAKAIMKRLADEFEQPLILCDEEFIPSVSVGIALYPRDGDTVQSLMRASDMAMYAAKHIRKMGKREARAVR